MKPLHSGPDELEMLMIKLKEKVEYLSKKNKDPQDEFDNIEIFNDEGENLEKEEIHMVKRNKKRSFKNVSPQSELLKLFNIGDNIIHDYRENQAEFEKAKAKLEYQTQIIEEFKYTNQKLRSANDDEKNVLLQFESEYQKTKQEFQEQKLEINKLKQQNKQLLSKLNYNEHDLTSKTQLLSQLQETERSQKDQIYQLKSELKICNNKVNDMKQDIEHYYYQMKELEEDNSKLKSDLQKLQIENRSLKAANDELNLTLASKILELDKITISMEKNFGFHHQQSLLSSANNTPHQQNRNLRQEMNDLNFNQRSIQAKQLNMNVLRSNTRLLTDVEMNLSTQKDYKKSLANELQHNESNEEHYQYQHQEDSEILRLKTSCDHDDLNETMYQFSRQQTTQMETEKTPPPYIKFAQSQFIQQQPRKKSIKVIVREYDKDQTSKSIKNKEDANMKYQKFLEKIYSDAVMARYANILKSNKKFYPQQLKKKYSGVEGRHQSSMFLHYENSLDISTASFMYQSKQPTPEKIEDCPALQKSQSQRKIDSSKERKKKESCAIF